MKHIKNFILLIIIGYLFIGCSQKVDFTSNYINSNLKKELKKVTIEQIDIKKYETVYLKKHPNSFRASATTLDINMTSLNENVLNEFFKQYFKNVSVVDKEGNKLFIDSRFYNYEYEYGFSDGNEVEVFVDMKVSYKNNIILEKQYVLKNDITALTLNLTIFSLAEENFHKTLLKLYETKFKPDLLKALKENM